MTDNALSPTARPWANAIMTRDEQREGKRRALILKAGMAFRRKGFRETSMEDVAQALGVSTGALYRYVKNKHEILFECHKLAMELGEAALAAGEASGTTGLDKVCKTIEYFIQNYSCTDSAGAATVNLDELRPEHRAIIVQRRDQFDRRLRALIKEGITDGSVAPCDPRVVTFSIMGAISWMPRWYDPEGELSNVEVTRQMVRLFVNGLRSPSSPSGE